MNIEVKFLLKFQQKKKLTIYLVNFQRMGALKCRLMRVPGEVILECLEINLVLNGSSNI